MQSAKASTSPATENARIIIEFHDLAAWRSLLSLHAPPPQDVPPANIQLRSGPFMVRATFFWWLSDMLPFWPANRYCCASGAGKTGFSWRADAFLDEFQLDNGQQKSGAGDAARLYCVA
jgi:hypothetical protein